MSMSAPSMSGGSGSSELAALLALVSNPEAANARIAELQELDARVKAEFEALRIGQDAKAAYEEAAALKERNAFILARAQAEADELRERGRHEARLLKDEADRILAQARDQAAAILADAEAQSARASAEAQAVLAEARKTLEANRAVVDEAVEATKLVVLREKEAEAAKADAELIIKRYNDAIAKIRAAAKDL